MYKLNFFQVNKLIAVIMIFICSILVGFSAYAQEKKEESFCSKKGSNLPEDTLYVANKDGSMSVRMPEGWFLLANKNGRWQRGFATDVTCTCDKPQFAGGGCSPATGKGKVVCVMDRCSQCSKSTSASFFPVRNEHDGIAFASREEVAKLPSVGRDLLMIPEVNKALSNFKRKLGIAEGAKGENLVMVRIFGHIGAMEVPNSARLPDSDSPAGQGALIAIATDLVKISAKAATCRCNDRPPVANAIQARCPRDGIFGVEWCDATNCNSCTMSIP